MSALPLPRSPGLPVLVVDDSAVLRRFVRAALAQDAALRVVAEARNGQEAVALVERFAPAVIVMDLNLPGMNGLEAIERIMARFPTPILVYSSAGSGTEAAAALAAGAVDVLVKPGPEVGLDRHAADLRSRLRLASRVRVITHPRGRLSLPEPPRPRTQPVTEVVADGQGRALPAIGPVGAGRRVRMIAIGASTGGPPALAAVLSCLPALAQVSVLVIQHMAEGFIEGLALWLDQLCALPVSVGADGGRLRPGTVTLAPGGCNFLVDSSLRARTQAPQARQFHAPGIDASFASIAASCGPAAVGVLLTGMGRDGAAGLRELRDRGGLTIAQDEQSSAVYGMPAAAVELGAAQCVLPLGAIGPALRQLARPWDEVGTGCP